MKKVIDNTNLGYLIGKEKAAFWQKTESLNVVLDDMPTENSNNLVKSGGVYDAIEDVLDAIDGTNVETVTVLPTASSSTVGKIYYVGPDGNGEYSRYRGIESGGSYSFLPLGSTEMDLTNYATKDEVDQLEAKVDDLIDDLSEPGGTEYVELTSEDADNTFAGKYLMANGSISTSSYYDTYCKGFPNGGKIQYSVGAANLGLFTADSNAQVGTRTKIAYYGDEDGTFEIPSGKYLFWDVLKSDPSKISIKVETVIPEHLKDFATMEDLEPVQEAVETFAPVAGQIAIDKVEFTATGTTSVFSKFVDLTTDKPFRISVELLSGSRKSNIDFYVSLYYSDAPSTQVVIKHNSFGFDESAVIVPEREISKILIYSPGYFLETSQVKFTISFDSDLWTAIKSERKPWTGKKIVTFGDSITELNDGAYMSWPDHFARTTGATVINLGLGGTRIKPRTYVAENTADWAYSQVDILNAVKAVVGGEGSAAFDAYESGMQYIYDNVGSLIVDKANILRILEDARSLDLNMVNAFVIFAGFNDWFAYNATKEEVFASLVELVQTVSSAYPNVQIYYCTPMPSFIGNVVDAEHFNLSRGGVTQEDFCGKMAEIGDGATQVNVFDAFHKMGINAYNGLFYYRTNDGVHPWDNTKTVGRKIGAWLNTKYSI